MRFSTHLSKGRAVNLISDDLETPALEFAGKGVGHFLGMGPRSDSLRDVMGRYRGHHRPENGRLQAHPPVANAFPPNLHSARERHSDCGEIGRYGYTMPCPGHPKVTAFPGRPYSEALLIALTASIDPIADATVNQDASGGPNCRSFCSTCHSTVPEGKITGKHLRRGISGKLAKQHVSARRPARPD